MHFEQEFINYWHITEYRLEKQFTSKKNNVCLVRAFLRELGERYFVVKEHRRKGGAAKREADLLSALYKIGVNVPRVYYKDKKSIIMDYIKGPTLLEAMTDAEYVAGEQFDYINAKGMASHLARWLDNFYKAAAQITGKKTILWDINLKNFLVGYKLYGIDFEDCREGVMEEDMGRLIAFIITYEPAFTPFKTRFARGVYNALGSRVLLDRERVLDETVKELDAIGERRAMEIPKDIGHKILL